MYIIKSRPIFIYLFEIKNENGASNYRGDKTQSMILSA